jgi:hypothetical protein
MFAKRRDKCLDQRIAEQVVINSCQVVIPVLITMFSNIELACKR